MALAGLGVFALLGNPFFQILCYGAGGAGVGSLRYPG
jgi:hypothetical protein